MFIINNNKGETITLFKTGQNRKFGAHTKLDWNSVIEKPYNNYYWDQGNINDLNMKKEHFDTDSSYCLRNVSYLFPDIDTDENK